MRHAPPHNIISGYAADHNSGITYMHYTGTPLYAFGFGLSFSTFSYAWSSTSPESSSTAHTTSSHDASTTTAAMAALHKVHYSLSAAERAARSPGYKIVVTNTGKVAAATSVLAFVDSSGALGGDVDAPANG